MSWFYVGKKEDNESRVTYRVVHSFDELQEMQVGNPLAGGTVQLVRMPKLTVDMVTKNRDEARMRVAFLNGGGGQLQLGATKSDNTIEVDEGRAN